MGLCFSNRRHQKIEPLKDHSVKRQDSSGPDKSEDKLSKYTGNQNSTRNSNEDVQIDGNNPSNNGSAQCGKVKDSFIFEDALKNMPERLKSQCGFIQINSVENLSYKECSVAIESTLVISHHLNTKLHEDNVLTSLRSLIPRNYLHELNFVSFYEQELSCNLSKCAIYLNSHNLYETIVSIFNHNACISHDHTKSDKENVSSDFSPLLRSISHIIPNFVNENKDSVAEEIHPQITCNLCHEDIIFEMDLYDTFKNFENHLNGKVHTKTANSSEVLSMFKKLNIHERENHNLLIKEGDIYCVDCACIIESDLEKLKNHVKTKTESCISKKNKGNVNKGVPFYKQLNQEPATQSKTAQTSRTKNEELLAVQTLLKTMPTQFNNVDYILRNKQGQLLCLLCDCVIPMSQCNLEQHLTGKLHRINEEHKRTSKKIPQTVQTNDKMIKNMIDKSNKPNSVSKQIKPGSIDDSTPVKFYDVDNIVRKEKGRLFCLLCNCAVPLSQHNLKEHLAGWMHKHNEEDKRTDKKIPGTIIRANGQTEIHKNITDECKQSDNSNCLINGQIKPDPINNFHKEIRKDYHHMCDELSGTRLSPLEGERKVINTVKEGLSHHNSGKKRLSGLEYNVESLSKEIVSSNSSMVLELMKFNHIIQLNSKFISKEGDNYLCMLCLTTIKQSTESTLLRDAFLKHFSKQWHKDLLFKKYNYLLNSASPAIKKPSSNSGLLKKPNSQSDCARHGGVEVYLEKSGELVKQSDSKYCEENIIDFDKVNLLNTTTQSPIDVYKKYLDVQSSIKTMPDGFSKNSRGNVRKVVKTNYEYIGKKEEGDFCTLIRDYVDLEGNHSSVQRHNDLLNHSTGNLLPQLFQSNPDIEVERDFLKFLDNKIHCILCDISITARIGIDILERIIAHHVSGDKHKANKKPVQTPEEQPVAPTYHNPSLPNKPAAPVYEHEQTPTFHPPHLPLLNQDDAGHLQGCTPSTFFYDPFSNLPPFLQDERQFITITYGCSNNSLTCTLCNISISPFYLSDHLLNENHKTKRFKFLGRS